MVILGYVFFSAGYIGMVLSGVMLFFATNKEELKMVAWLLIASDCAIAIGLVLIEWKSIQEWLAPLL